MIFRAEKIPNHLWDANAAHLVTFGENRPQSLNSFHFVLGAVDGDNQLAGYCTCIELDKESLYLQHGGVLPNYAKSIYVLKSYGVCVEWCLQNYKRVSTKVQNTNISMLKLAMQMGFLIVGTSTFKDKVFVDLLLEYP